MVELNPKVPEVHAELAASLVVTGHLPEAVEELRAALRLAPGSSAGNDLAWILATAPDDTIRNGSEAVRLAEAACRGNEFREPQLLDTLAAAHAEAGQFRQAQEIAARALELARRQPNAELLKALEARQELYQQGRPYRDPSLNGLPQAPVQP